MYSKKWRIILTALITGLILLAVLSYFQFRTKIVGGDIRGVSWWPYKELLIITFIVFASWLLLMVILGRLGVEFTPWVVLISSVLATAVGIFYVIFSYIRLIEPQNSTLSHIIIMSVLGVLLLIVFFFFGFRFYIRSTEACATFFEQKN